MVRYTVLFDSVTIPSDTGINVDVREDSDQDGTVETVETISLSDGQTEYETGDVFAGSGDVSLRFELTPASDLAAPSPTVTAPIDVSGQTASISGTVTLDGSGVDGATIYVIDQGTDSIEVTTTTASDGTYSATVAANQTVHVVVEYEDSGGVRYVAASQSFIDT